MPGRFCATKVACLYWTTISTRRFCGSRTPSPVGTSRLGFRPADDGDRLGRHALAHQRVLDRVGAAQRQRHVVALRTRRVGVAGRRDAGAALALEGRGRLTDRGQRLVREVRAIPVEEHHEGRRRHGRRRRRRRGSHFGLAELIGDAQQRHDVVVEVGARIGRAVVAAFQRDAQRWRGIVAEAHDALVGEHARRHMLQPWMLASTKAMPAPRADIGRDGRCPGRNHRAGWPSPRPARSGRSPWRSRSGRRPRRCRCWNGTCLPTRRGGRRSHSRPCRPAAQPVSMM